MDIEELLCELKKNGIRESAFQINSSLCAEGALCLKSETDQRWAVIFVERGEYLINESFTSEHDACMYFLKRALMEPTNRIAFNPAELDLHKRRLPELLKSYGFEQ